MSTSDKFSVVISIIALIFSALTLGFQFHTYFDKKSEISLSRAPRLMISSMIYQPYEYKFPDNYLMPEDSEFILEKRHYFHNNNLENSVMSLIIDACPTGSHSQKTRLINIDKIKIENIGFESVYMEIQQININRPIGGEINIAPTKQNKIVGRINVDNPLIMYTSIIFNSESGLFDTRLLTNEVFIDNKLHETGGELLNSRLDELIDLWDKIEIVILTKNTYNEFYEQTLEIYIENNTFFATQSEPRSVSK